MHNHGPIDKNEKGKKQEKLSSSSEGDVKEEDAWIQLLINYHGSVLSSWDFAIDVGAKLAKSTISIFIGKSGIIIQVFSRNVFTISNTLRLIMKVIGSLYITYCSKYWEYHSHLD